MSRRDWIAEQAEIICDLYDEADDLLEDYGPDKSDRFEQLLDQIESKCQRLIEDFEEQSTDPEKQTILRVTKGRVYSSLKALRNIKELCEGKPVATSFSSHSENSYSSRAVVVQMKTLFSGCFITEKDRG